ncbi:hypothetical protein AGABI2DRAFT_119317 [Agaricus bisporus var. bisporus H97]|uniref:hypothetical protein n=1 Tax=Agaricus bisporus var. bisporus (strain H97 / ATCC MYA-4626 / FGSC 10389) TaxID=936046 RepID=UPI00029F6043|nr:hypothetical protein AGABI2DRAFT_119317 [Agaricus bisporus var. bisporus H97]EKV45637.1 hypothetical protein AGABI2DRAFT_119317 [Agaricus bisporus var. bisporus H97]
MSSNVDDIAFAAFANSAGTDSTQNSHQNYHQRQAVVNGSSASWQRPSPGYQPPQHRPSDHSIPAAGTATHVNGAQPTHRPKAPSFQRIRTYSAVDGSLQMNGSARLPRRTANASPTDMSRSPRPGESKPTRIPKVSRGPPGSNASASVPTSPLMNGTSTSGVSPLASHTTPTQSFSPYAPSSSDIRPFHFPTSHSSHANLGPSQPSRIINEPAPFNTASSSNSSIYEVGGPVGEFGNHRPHDSVGSIESNTSMERPFEHWYRGEVSRNGGVGEIRVGKRQEMLDIANYGHAINNKRKAIANRRAALQALEEHRVLSISRKRADSLAGISSKMRQRESFYLDEIIDQGELAAHLGRVLDEDPLTDLESGDGSDIGSVSHHGRQQCRFSNHDSDYDFIPGVGDITTTGSSMNGYRDSSINSPSTSYEVSARSTTPTPSVIQMQHPPRTTTPTQKPKSRRGSSASRIPTLSSERKSSESRTSTPTISSKSQPQQGVVDLTPTPPSQPVPHSVPLPPATTPARKASNSFSSAPSSTPSSSSHHHNKRGVSPGPRAAAAAATTATAPPSTPSSSHNKRGISPGPHAATASGSTAKKARTGVGPKSPKTVVKSPKPKSAMKKSTSISKTPEDPRRSSAQYPSPGGDDDDGMDMADAIPSWTQPKPGEGNWDDVVLPVVARKKGLEDFYEKADGSPQQKKPEDTPIAPAPGTFGFDGTKVRRSPNHDDGVEMAEFGGSIPPPGDRRTGRIEEDVLEEIEPGMLLEQGQQRDDAIQMSQFSPAREHVRMPPPVSMPFAEYSANDTLHIVSTLGRPRKEEPVEVEDGGGGGCCKCVVM